MLHIHNLSVSVDHKQVLHTFDALFELGLNYCIIGKNGSGKSSLAMSIMWHPHYQTDSWSIMIQWEWSFLDWWVRELLQQRSSDCDLDTIIVSDLSPDMRSKLGIFVAFQHIPEVKWVKLFEFLRTIYNAKRSTNETFLSFKKIIEPLVASLDIERDFLRRDLNVGFSGWERRKIEILQLTLLKPRYIILDEVDSWLDIDAFKSVAQLLQRFNSPDNTFIIITHYFHIMEYIPIDYVYLMKWWSIDQMGWLELIEKIKQEWFWE